MRQSTQEAKGVQTKVNPSNIVYNATLDEIDKMVPFEKRSATLKTRIKFLLDTIKSVSSIETPDEESKAIATKVFDTLVEQTVEVLDSEYELRPTNRKKSREEYFGNRFIPYCLPPSHVYNPDNEAVEINVDGPTPTFDALVPLMSGDRQQRPKVKKGKGADTSLFCKPITEEERNPDLTKELATNPPKPISFKSLGNETHIYDVDGSGDGIYVAGSTNHVFDTLYKYVQEKIDRIKKSGKRLNAKNTENLFRPSKKEEKRNKESIERVNKMREEQYMEKENREKKDKQMIHDRQNNTGMFELQKEYYEPLRDSLGRFFAAKKKKSGMKSKKAKK